MFNLMIFMFTILHLCGVGSVIGSMILSSGFYTVIWGKAREDAAKRASVSEQSLLLPKHNIEDENLIMKIGWMQVKSFNYLFRG